MPDVLMVAAWMDDSPLNDPTYVPAHPPLANGGIPPVVERWGPRSQVRWFMRFSLVLGVKPLAIWARFYADSVEHKGLCCSSCSEDQMDGYDSYGSGCCCLSQKADITTTPTEESRLRKEEPPPGRPRKEESAHG